MSQEMLEDNNTAEIDQLGDEETLTFQYDVSSYTIDFDVAGLVRRYKNGDIIIPDFQRNYVWDDRRASQFVETLLLGLPVPGVFLSKSDSDEVLLVVDGLQRIQSLARFYKDELPLSHVQSQFEGKTYSQLNPNDRRRLDNAFMPATVIKQESPTDDDSGIYFVFRRLNTGAVALRPQEIRSAIYRGEFNDLLGRLNKFALWRKLYIKNQEEHPRKNDEEAILRFFALYYYSKDYTYPIETFLNRYMSQNRRLTLQSEQELTERFTTTIQTIHDCLGERAFKRSTTFNVAVFDSIMVGIARRLEKGPIQDCDQLKANYHELLKNDTFLKATGGATSRQDTLSTRLRLATAAFENID
ncbi:MAG: DUF262 domain-containing protein [Anaerolineae bacterium]|jgi:hypothetical protein|nr:DUF262 domain-containing protein [Anaerolineae bacterium]